MKRLTLTLLLVFLIWPLEATAKDRIITLAPHLTEWVYSLGAGDDIVAVSAHSNYPAEALSLPRVANYQGIDFTAIARLQPTLILAWEGGNRPQDIARLLSLGINVYASAINTPEDIATELKKVGSLLGKVQLAEKKVTDFVRQLRSIEQQYASQKSVSVFYYTWSKPLMSVGKDAWAAKLLSVCGGRTIFADSPADYPQVSVQEVLRRQPDMLIASTTEPLSAQQRFWEPHRPWLSAPVISVIPDIFSRFTLRLPKALGLLCEQIDSVRHPPLL